MPYMWIIWLAIFVITLIVESLSSELLSLWFSFGALVALILSFISGVEWWIQLIIFVVISITLLLCLRPLTKKLLKKNLIKSNVDEIIHKKGIMIKECDELEHGEVKINGVIWTAISQDEKVKIDKDSIVEVVAIEGNKLVVKEIKGETK